MQSMEALGVPQPDRGHARVRAGTICVGGSTMFAGLELAAVDIVMLVALRAMQRCST